MKEKLLEKIQSNKSRIEMSKLNISEIDGITDELKERQQNIINDLDKANTRETIIGNGVIFLIIASTAFSLVTKINTVNMQNVTELQTALNLFEVPAIVAVSSVTLALADTKIQLNKLKKKYKIKGNIDKEVSDITKEITENNAKKERLEISTSYDKARLDLLQELEEYYDEVTINNLPVVEEVEQKTIQPKEELKFDLVFNEKGLSRTRTK